MQEDLGNYPSKEMGATHLAELYRHLVESSPDAIFIHRGGRFRFVNAAGARLFSASDPSELVAKSLAGFTHPDYRKTVEQLLIDIEGGKKRAHRFEAKFYRVDGSVIEAEVNLSLITLPEGNAVQAVIRDIGDQKRASESVRASEEYYRDLVEHSRDLMCTHDLEGRILSVNEAAVKVSGYGAGYFLGKNIREFLAPEFQSQFDEYLLRVKRDGYAEGLMQVETRAGERRIWQYYNTVRTDGGEDAVVRGMAHDVTELKRAEERILKLNKQLEERVVELQTLFEVIPIGIGIAEDSECKSIKVNPYFAKALGIPPGANGSLSAPAAERPTNFKVYREGQELSPDELPMQYAAANGVTVTDVEVEVAHDDATTVKLLEYAAPLFDEQGNVRGCVGAFLDITERKRVEEALRQSEQYYRGLFENAHDAILIFDPHGEVILDVNQRACDVYGFSRREFIGMSLEKISKDVSKGKSKVSETLSSELSHHFETVQYRKDGSEMFLEVNASVVNHSGRQAILTINRDITERKLADQERERLLASERAARAEAESANRAKDEFLATVSHELRAPLTSILLWAHTLRSSKLDAAVARGLEAIERNSKAQAKLIEDILDVSRIVSGKLRLNTRPTNLLSVITGAVDAVRPATSAKRIDLQIKADASTGEVVGDPDRLQQVVWNLLSNAVKFTDAGGSIEVKLEGAGPHALITVTDTGQGISPEFLPYVFERFRQADGLFTRQHGGLGLGLAIVRHLVEMHGGAVEVESAGEGSGACFKVRLPLKESQGLDNLQQSEATRTTEYATPNRCPSIVEGLRVIIVDDDADTREAVLVMLEQHGAKVKACSSAAEAIELLQRYRPDILVSDIAMPDEDGYSLINKVRALSTELGGRVPAVALTAHVRAEDRSRALSAGYQAFLSKPVEVDELLVSIAALAMGTEGHSS